MIDIHKARKNLEQKIDDQKRYNSGLYTAALSDAEAIIKLIIDNYNPERIIQWGSLLSPEDFNENSDIDIAIEGLNDAEAYFELLGKAMQKTRFRLDIVEIDKIEPEFAESIRLRGRVVYEKQR